MNINNDELIQFENKIRELNPNIKKYIEQINNNNNDIENIKKKEFKKVSELMRELTIPIGFYVEKTNNNHMDFINTEYKDNNVIDDNLFDKLYSLAEYKNDDAEVIISKKNKLTKKNKKSTHRRTKKK